MFVIFTALDAQTLHATSYTYRMGGTNHGIACFSLKHDK